VAEVRALLLDCSQSVDTNPQWIQYQKRMDDMALQYQRARQQGRMQALGQQVQQFQARMQGMRNQVSAFQRGQNAQAAQVNEWSNMLTGVTPTTDPLTGTSRTVWTGPRSSNWTNGRGDVRNSDLAPGGGWRQLRQ